MGPLVHGLHEQRTHTLRRAHAREGIEMRIMIGWVVGTATGLTVFLAGGPLWIAAASAVAIPVIIGVEW